MEQLVRYLLFTHVAFGTLALLSGLGAILLRNNVKKHKPFGKVYFWCMSGVFITAVIVSIAHRNIFLFCVAFFTYYSTLTAFRSLKLKKIPYGQKPLLIDWIIEVFFGMMHIAFIAFGLLLLQNNPEFGIISSVFGLIGLRGNYLNVKRLRGFIEHSNYWLLAHIGGMLGSYTGAFTAFLVNNNNRFIHMPQMLAWLGPAMLIVPLIVFEINKYKKKGKLLR